MVSFEATVFDNSSITDSAFSQLATIGFSTFSDFFLLNQAAPQSFLALASIASTPERFVAILFLVLFGFQFAIGNLQTIPSDLFSGKSVCSLAGLGGMIGVFSVIIMNFLVLLAAKISYTPILLQ